METNRSIGGAAARAPQGTRRSMIPDMPAGSYILRYTRIRTAVRHIPTYCKPSKSRGNIRGNNAILHLYHKHRFAPDGGIRINSDSTSKPFHPSDESHQIRSDQARSPFRRAGYWLTQPVAIILSVNSNSVLDCSSILLSLLSPIDVGFRAIIWRVSWAYVR